MKSINLYILIILINWKIVNISCVGKPREKRQTVNVIENKSCQVQLSTSCRKSEISKEVILSFTIYLHLMHTCNSGHNGYLKVQTIYTAICIRKSEVPDSTNPQIGNLICGTSRIASVEYEKKLGILKYFKLVHTDFGAQRNGNETATAGNSSLGKSSSLNFQFIINSLITLMLNTS